MMTYNPMAWDPPAPLGDIVQVAAANGNFGTLLATATQLNLAGALQGAGPLTPRSFEVRDRPAAQTPAARLPAARPPPPRKCPACNGLLIPKQRAHGVCAVRSNGRPPRFTPTR